MKALSEYNIVLDLNSENERAVAMIEKIAEIQRYKAELGWHIGEQAKRSGEQFALGLQELMSLMEDD